MHKMILFLHLQAYDFVTPRFPTRNGSKILNKRIPRTTRDPGYPLRMEMVYNNALKAEHFSNAIYLTGDPLLGLITHVADRVNGDKSFRIDHAHMVH